MKNIEGIKSLEIPEQSIEKNSMTITENVVLDSEDIVFSDCAKTPEDKIKELQSIKEELLYYNSCVKTGQTDDLEEDYEDCRRK